MTDADALADAHATTVARVARILDRQGIVDGHDDLAWALRERAEEAGGSGALVPDALIARLDVEHAVPGLHTDLPRLVRGGVAA